MACNENVIKNMANEITRNCQANGVNMDPEFVIYMIELLLLNPKYGKLFSKTINRDNLEYFVNQCVAMLIRAETSISTLKMQYLMNKNYDKVDALIEKHLHSIDKCLRPLVNEILEEDPDPANEEEIKKLFRKISVYIILASGLGNPGQIVTLKEGMAALESVFSLEDLKSFVTLPRAEKIAHLNDLMEVVSGVRLFNRDCKKGGAAIPDLPFDLVDAGKACIAALSNSLITVMQRVNSLTTAIEDNITIEEETGNVLLEINEAADFTADDYKVISEQLIFNRQYEAFIRGLLSDVEIMFNNGTQYVTRAKGILEDIHAAVKYKAAVPVVAVFPLFSKLWKVWRSMQNMMFFVSTVNRLMATLAGIQDLIRIPYNVLDKMLTGKSIVTDQERLQHVPSVEERLSLGSIKNYFGHSDTNVRDKNVQFLGFCTLCLNVGALVPCHLKIGTIKLNGQRYGFCSAKMATQFAKDQERYRLEVLDYVRNHPHLIHFLNVEDELNKLKNIDTLVVKYVPKKQVFDKDMQTEVHPIESHMEKNYTWDLWEWKKRACQWANIVNCKTHSTQTHYSHLRSEVQCQTVEPRDKGFQTKRDQGMNTVPKNIFLWGLRGQWGYGQHAMPLIDELDLEKLKPQPLTLCEAAANMPKASMESMIGIEVYNSSDK